MGFRDSARPKNKNYANRFTSTSATVTPGGGRDDARRGSTLNAAALDSSCCLGDALPMGYGSVRYVEGARVEGFALPALRQAL